MAKTIYTGKHLTGAAMAASTVHSAAGRLLAILVSHAQAAVQTVTIYDNTAASGTVIMKLNVDPGQCPYYVEFPRNAGIAFSTGMHVVNGWCDINLWSLDYG